MGSEPMTGVAEPAALVPPPPIPHGPEKVGGHGDVNNDRQVNDIVKAVVVEDQESKVIGAIAGSRHVTNVVKTLQQVFDTAKTLNSNHLPLSVATSDELPWYSLSSYDCLMTFAATPRLLFTKTLSNALNIFFDMVRTSAASGQHGDAVHSKDGGVNAGGSLVTKCGILMEKTSLISIEFLIDQGFRRVGNYSSFVVLDIEIPHHQHHQ